MQEKIIIKDNNNNIAYYKLIKQKIKDSNKLSQEKKLRLLRALEVNQAYNSYIKLRLTS